MVKTNNHTNKTKHPVLLVEDDETQLKLLAGLLEMENLQPICCQTGREALTAFREKTVNVAILDLELPDTDGLEVLKQLKERAPHIKVIINTGYPSLETAMAAVNEKAFAYVKKSGDVEELLGHIHRAFHQHLANYSELLEGEVERRTEELIQANDDLKKEIAERKRVEEALRHRAEEMEFLYKIWLEISAHADLSMLLEAIVRWVVQLLDVQQGALFLLKPDQERLALAASHNFSEPQLDLLVSLSDDLAGKVVARREPIMVADYGRWQDERIDATPDLGLGRVLGMPLKRGGDRVIGVLFILDEKAGDFSQDEIRLLTLFAAQAATAIENTRLFKAECEQRELAEALREVGTALSATLDFDLVLDRLLEQIGRVVPYDAANVALIENGRSRVVRMRGYEQFGPTVVDEMTALSFDIAETPNLSLMAETGQPLVIPDTADYPGWVRVEATAHAHSWAGAPIMGQGQVVAFFSLDRVEPGFYQPEHATRLAAFAGQAAIAIENARLHQETQKQARQVRQILDSVPDGILLLNTEHRIEQANPAAKTYLKQLAGVGVGETLTYLGAQSLSEILETSGDGHGREISQNDASRRVFEVAAESIGAGQQAEGWVIVLRDITEERAIQERMRQQDRLAAVGQLAAGIAHDFNNILTSIIGYSELIRLDPSLSEMSRGDLNLIIKQGERAAHLIRQILDFSRRSIIEKRSIDLKSLLREMVALLRRTMSEDIRISLEIEPSDFPYFLKADPAQIQQALTNLAFNARDAMSAGGQLKFRLAHLNVKSESHSPISGLWKGQWLVLEVSDTGIGIEPEHQPFLFEPFFTTKEVGEGTGLGLSQVYGIVKQHEGHIDVASEPGKGTVFTLCWPALPEAPKALPALAPMNAPHGEGEVILLVEDDPSVLGVTRAMLERLQYRVLTARNGKEALELHDQHRGEIALVLTDVTMPDIDGIALAQALRQRDAEIKIVALTGYPLDEEDQDQLAEGIVYWLQKPLNFTRLAEIVNQALGRFD